jgi:RNA polymerase sigma-70 factor (ECF subfamily)
MMPNEVQLEVGACDDVSLVHNAKRGNVDAFEELIRRHTEMILRVATHITTSREDAEDVAQEAFLKAFQNLKFFEERARFSTWLTKIAINESLIKLRRRRASMVSIDEDGGEFRSLEYKLIDGQPNPEQVFSTTQLSEALERALDTLPPPYRVVFEMRDVQGKSTLDTAEVLELSVPSVKARLLRARLKLRKCLGPHFERRRAITASSLATEQRLNESRAAA